MDCTGLVLCDILFMNLSQRKVIDISTILIADGSEIFIQAMAEAIGRDHKVHICHDGVIALDLLNEIRPDGLVLDLCLPHMTGIDVLKASAYHPPIILGITNIVTDDVLVAAESAGIKYLFRRPCRPNVVASYLLKTLNSKEKAAP